MLPGVAALRLRPLLVDKVAFASVVERAFEYHADRKEVSTRLALTLAGSYKSVSFYDSLLLWREAVFSAGCRD